MLLSLQKGHGREQIAGLDGRFPVVDMGGELDDLMDAAALMTALDLVIVSNTSLAHLAGGAGRAGLGGAAGRPDWRWMSGRDDSPWYPSMRLFRQRRWGDWDEVFARIAGELEGAWACERAAPAQEPRRPPGRRERGKAQ